MESKYQRLKIDFLSEFVLGKNLPGSFLPSEREIASSYGVSRISVRHAIDELLKGGYLKKTPNGRNIVCGLPNENATRSLLLVMRNLHSVLPDFYRMLYEALLLKCSFSGISLFFCEAKRLNQLVKNGQHFDAALGIGFDLQQRAKGICSDRFLVLDEVKNCLSPCIGTDNYLGGRLAAEHLRQCGCRSAVFVGLVNQENYPPFEKRKRGFTDYMQEYEIPVIRCDVSNSSPKTCYSALMGCPELRQANGMFIVYDYLAINVLHALAKLEISVPGQMSVIAFDGLPCGAYLLPSLSTVEQPVNALADKVLEAAFSETPPTDNVFLPPHVIQRGSSVPQHQ